MRSWSARVSGSMAIETTGAGKVGASSSTGASSAHSVWPVAASFSPPTTAMSPAKAAGMAVSSSARISETRLMRSCLPVTVLSTVSPGIEHAEYAHENVPAG